MSSVLGIDLGTTYSVIAYVDERGGAKIIPNSDNERSTPSVVFFETGSDVVVGQNAKDELEISPESVVSFVKREIGKKKDEVRKDENYGTPKPYDFFGKRYSPEEISALILQKLKEDAHAHFGRKDIVSAVITVPAYFNDFERKATVEAGKIAGLNVLQVINEPTAAAISYGVKADRPQKVFVFDLGGGTFDITIIDVSNGNFNVLATDGDHRLGGKDWDDKIIEAFSNEFIDQYGEDPRDDVDAMAELRIKSEKMKKDLSKRDKSTMVIKTRDNSMKMEIFKEQFEQLCSDLISRIEGLCDSILGETHLNWTDISEIVLAGGSTRLPMVRNLLTKMSGKIVKADLVNPDECVALGAAIYGASVMSPKGLGSERHTVNGIASIQDVASHSLGFVTMKEGALYNSIMIKKNTSIPGKVMKSFTTIRDNQEVLEVMVLQGESATPENCTVLYGYEYQELPRRPKGQVQIDVIFQYDLDGVVEVSASADGATLPFKKIERPELPKLQASEIRPLAVILAIDLSGSMSGNPLVEAQNAAINHFVAQLDFNTTKVALMPFADSVSVNRAFTNSQRDLEGGINEWRIGMVGGGNSAEPFEKALDLLQYEDARKLIVVLTDGRWGCQSRAEQNASKCKQRGIEIKAIGFGGADIGFLKLLSSSDDDWAFTGSKEELEQTMSNIATEITLNKLKS